MGTGALEVNVYDDGLQDVLAHDDEVTASTDFIQREAAWALQALRRG